MTTRTCTCTVSFIACSHPCCKTDFGGNSHR